MENSPSNLSSERSITLMTWLGYLGLIPFSLCIATFTPDGTFMGVNTRMLFLSYSAIILSFLCGILWSHALTHASHKLSFPILALSNLICLMAWLVIVITPEQFRLGIVVALAGYVCVWLIERIKFNALGNEFPKPYQRLRSISL
ncbi:DUF3429 domain-containing protein [Vibrio variabilis]|uniref:DUF3429 domain-containing protein n=1 Tax=Vibrio variabilis TaxID=990271 RepID=UPI000DD8D19F|nr:DUF3429 domain-containing protein [Vibrio variabilis]